MTVQVEIRVPATTNGERLLVRPVLPDGQLAGAEELVGPDERATFYVWEGITLELHAMPRAVAAPVLALELEDPGVTVLDLRGRPDAVPA